MGNILSSLFGLDEEENRSVSILLIQSVFLGIFWGVFNITAHSLFLSRFDEQLMARAYIISGLLGIGLTYAYTQLQSRLRFNIFSSLNLGFVLLVTLLLWFMLTAFNDSFAIFAVFIMMGPLNLLALLSFYGTAGRLFTLRQGRRLFGLVDTGIVLGVIISSFSIPALLAINIQTSNILLLSAISVFAALMIQFVIGRRFEQVRTLQASEGKSKRESLKVFREDAYVMSMGIFIALSVVVAFFIQYSFMAVTRARYPLEQDMASFLGLFEGSMMVFTLLIKTFIFTYLLKNHGLKVALLIAPVLVGLFILCALITGTFMGYEPGTSGFMVFFLILALARLFSKAMKDSIETPAFKVLYQTLAEKVRFTVQSAIDGTINELAALTSGLLLTGLGALAFVKLIHFSWVLSLLLALWIYSALRLYSEYRKSVRKSMGGEGSGQTDKSRITSGSGRLAFELYNDYYCFISGETKSQDFVSDTLAQELIIRFSEMNPSIEQLSLLDRLEKNISDEGVRDEFNRQYAKLRESFNSARGLSAESSDFGHDERISFLSRSYTSGDKIILTDLLKLIRDKNIDVRRKAIYVCGRQREKELLPDVCECLGVDGLHKDAYSVLRSFGVDALQYLSSYYFRYQGDVAVRVLIIRLCGELGSAEAVPFLFDRLGSVHRELKNEAVNALLKCNFHPGESETDRIDQEIISVIGLLTWIKSASVTLKNKKDNDLLISIEEDASWWKNYLFGLLSLVYDPMAISRIKESLESATIESVNMALEMLDILVDDSIKPRLNALLDVSGDEDKLKSLFQFYPGEIPLYDELLIDIVNTDYNRVGIWTKTCALKSLEHVSDVSNPDFLVALLFSPCKVLREEALRLIDKRFVKLYDECAYRLPDDFSDHSEQLHTGKISTNRMMFDRIIFLKEVFPLISTDHLAELALKLEYLENINPEEKDLNFVAWQRGKDGITTMVNWPERAYRCMDRKDIDWKEKPFYLIGIKTIADFIFRWPENKDIFIDHIEENCN